MSHDTEGLSAQAHAARYTCNIGKRRKGWEESLSRWPELQQCFCLRSAQHHASASYQFKAKLGYIYIGYIIVV